MKTLWSGEVIRQKFLDFFAAKSHRVLASASLVPEDPTVLLTIAGMLPFKPIFLGQQQPEFPRATTSQKCIRTNDIENVGRTARHHTFFEMLGNFSFGDYFKPEAIAWAWELLTQVYELSPDRLLVSVFEDDDEAFQIWHEKVGIPAHRIQRMGADSNFWAAGPTGPCGPCSEIYYDFYPDKGDAEIDLDDDSRFLELYNLVFMQSNRDSQGEISPLQNKNIDTGMGLERMAQVLQAKPNNYETDLIFPIIQTVAEIAGLDYAKSDQSIQTSLKVVGDHTRAVTQMIADGITASNVGRGYVLRRLIRRIVRHGRLLGIDKPFTPAVAETAIALAESAYPTLRLKSDQIKAELDREEESFLKTLDRGEKMLAEIVEKIKEKAEGRGQKAEGQKVISGQDAFVLYDTYGFPLELTQEIAEEQGLTVDVAGFEAEMAAQRDRSRDAHETIDLTVQGTLNQLAEQVKTTEFLGYSQFSATAEVAALLVHGQAVKAAEAGTSVQVVLDQTPFYAESGGQIGDRGYLSGENLLVRIEDVQKESGIFVHYGRVERGDLHLGDRVKAQVDLACRRRVQAHHTATHLLQSALKKLVDDGISQAGSLVAFDRLRFDFNCPRSLTAAEVQQVEDLVNTWIAEAHLAQTSTLPIAEAKAKGAIAMFGEKYGAEVRVLDVAGVSMELCGGTHVSNTAEIGLFKIIAETGVASGVRRIEAVAGPAVLEYLNLRERVVRDLSDRFKVKPEEVPDRVTALQAELKASQKQLDALRSELALVKADGLLAQAESIGKFKLLVAQLEGIDAEALKTAAERLLQKIGTGAVVLGSAPEPEKVSLVAAFSPEVIQQGLQAGKFIGEIAKLCGGGGGGRPHLAQAGGRDGSQLPAALQVAQEKLQSALN
ncbi:MAG: alanine--tRNA ligase [Aphanocapsa sp. GSE-SYN-MK-11-07L]|jgi:alanyl-tRNA synthetase|nr:alanine--tRNA ligase [Aphanocapsa sp. GSE-SYN-MK-11-07L]